MCTEAKRMHISYLGTPIELGYTVRSGDKGTVLFLHGLGASKDDFHGALENKNLNDYALVMFDFPGHGESPYVTNLTMDNLVDITKLFADSLELHEFFLVGHSMGWVVGLLYIQKHKADVNAFVNIEGNLTGADCNFSRNISNLDYPTFEQQYGRSMRAMYDCSHSLAYCSEQTILLSMYAILPISALYIYGSESMISCIDELQTLGCETFEVLNSGHHPFLTHPDEFYGVISLFLSRCHTRCAG